MSVRKRLLVTGANGFIGRSFCAEATQRGYSVVGAVRSTGHFPQDWPCVAVGAIDHHTDWHTALTSVDIVVHLAARVHVMNEAAGDPLAAFRQVNVAGTLNLARQAAASGVQRFIFISSVKVNGEESDPAHPFTAEDIPTPGDPYGVSKMEAEQGLRIIATQTGMAVIIIRPPLVYGPGVKANFQSMMQWLARGIPLPLGAIANRRSMVALSNLVDLIMLCCVHAAAANQTFMVSDGEDLSTTELLRRMARALGRRALLVPVPLHLIVLCAAIFGKRDTARRLCGFLQVDISKTQSLLGWLPPLSVDASLLLAGAACLDGTKGIKAAV